LTRDDLARIVGASREAASRTLCRLRRAGFIDFAGRRIIMRNSAKA
jgi:CRP-like cAMP-binding protein